MVGQVCVFNTTIPHESGFYVFLVGGVVAFGESKDDHLLADHVVNGGGHHSFTISGSEGDGSALVGEISFSVLVTDCPSDRAGEVGFSHWCH